MNFTLWLPIFAAVLVALYHSLSDDGAASILDHFGIAFRFPPKALPVVILAFAVASGTVSSVVDGKDWQAALAAAFTTAIAGVFGAVTQHGLVNRTVPKSAGALLVAGALSLAIGACAAFQKALPFLPTPNQSECILVDVEAGKPALTIIGECGLEQDAIAYIESLLVGQKRKAAHQRAAAALDAGTDGEAGK